MKRAVLIFLIMGAVGLAGAQDFEMIGGVDKEPSCIMMPTAYTDQKGQYEFHLEMSPFRTHIAVGVTNRLMLGVSYGGENVIGTEEIDWYPRVEFLIKYNIIEEKYSLPAITAGYSAVGWGRYFDGYDRYMIKSRGFFAVASKDINLMGGMNIHGGVNYSHEGSDAEDKNGLNIFFAGEKKLNEELSILGEYDMALNDNGENCIGDGKGYFNLGIRWKFAPELIIDFQLINMFANFNTDPEDGVYVPEEYNEIARNIAITYRAFF